jgi:diaminohydroxyphosphoribosylaminopyrimidine deaminase / 5-amino-6-(5-phosphoribosylamino)uracil reductase
MAIKQYMLHALRLAQQAKGQCAPNPCVGAVIVQSGDIIATGYHHGVGQPHAEIEALRQAIQGVKGASLYVTLEPCCHYGRTPPCTDALIKAGIKEVIYAYSDPNPHVSGRGVEQLQHAGIMVTKMLLEEVDDFYDSYAFWWKYQQPWVTLKLAMSLDGKIAGINNKPAMMTGEACHAFTHRQRYEADAIFTTINTVMNDDPQMNARLHDKVMAKRIYILDPQLKMPMGAKIWATAKKITLFYDDTLQSLKIANYQQQGAICIPIRSHAGRLDLLQLLEYIGQEGVHNLWVEAGGQVSEALLKQHLVQRAYFYVAPISLGEGATANFESAIHFSKAVKSVRWHSMGVDAMCQLNW